jgi:hypothetical protein
MYVTSNATAAPISVSPARALENVEARIRRIDEFGGGKGAATQAVLDRLEAEREIWQQQQADEETIRRWELLHARYLEYRRGRASARGGDAQGRARVKVLA